MFFFFRGLLLFRLFIGFFFFFSCKVKISIMPLDGALVRVFIACAAATEKQNSNAVPPSLSFAI